MKYLALSVFLCFPFRIFGQLPEAPPPKHDLKHMIIANATMYGSSVLGAHATYFGSRNCYREDQKVGGSTFQAFGLTGYSGGQLHPWRRSFTLSLPADSVISATSYFLYKKHHRLLAVVLPSGSAGMQIGIAGVQYSQGCF